MKKKILVLSCKKYNFTNDKGQNFKGSKLSYINEGMTTGFIHGFVPFQVSTKDDILLDKIPGVFECDSCFIPNSNGQSVEQISNLNFRNKVDLLSLFK